MDASFGIQSLQFIIDSNFGVQLLVRELHIRRVCNQWGVMGQTYYVMCPTKDASATLVNVPIKTRNLHARACAILSCQCHSIKTKCNFNTTSVPKYNKNVDIFIWNVQSESNHVKKWRLCWNMKWESLINTISFPTTNAVVRILRVCKERSIQITVTI